MDWNNVQSESPAFTLCVGDGHHQVPVTSLGTKQAGMDGLKKDGPGYGLSQQFTSSKSGVCVTSGLWTLLFSSEQVAMAMRDWLPGCYRATPEDLCVCPSVSVL